MKNNIKKYFLIVILVYLAGCFSSANVKTKKEIVSPSSLPGMDNKKINNVNDVKISTGSNTAITENKKEAEVKEEIQFSSSTKTNADLIESSTAQTYLNENLLNKSTDQKVISETEINISTKTFKQELSLSATEQNVLSNEIFQSTSAIAGHEFNFSAEKSTFSVKDELPVLPPPNKAEKKEAGISKPKSPGIRTHKVLPGDTLPKLAEKYYGDKSSWIKIYEANKDKVEKGFLDEGEQLVIP